ncbi:MAG: site-2 protease family protein [Deltaproteobacteria bacterium]|nr:site-2 protease family protein [Deltaproteobacteria bacterium]
MSGIRLFKILGIRITIDYTWFLVFVLFAWSLAQGYFPYNHPGFGRGAYIVMGALSSLLLFVCVLVHEIAHSYVSNLLGVGVKEITLFIFGGVAKLSKEPTSPGVEFKIAVAGPLASAALAVLFKAASMVINAGEYPAIVAVTGYLAMVNVALLIFNMIPGFPLDGGRVLRAVWWAKTGNMETATRVASAIGKGFAMFLIVVGVIQALSGNAFGLWSVFIGVFLRQAAQGSYQQLVMRHALEGLKVRDIMTKEVVTVDAKLTIEELVEHYFFKYRFMSFPVTTGSETVGIITLNTVRGVDKNLWARTTVSEVMLRLTPVDTLAPGEAATDVFEKLQSSEAGRFPVMEATGALVGMLSTRDIMRAMELKSRLGNRTFLP